MRSHIITIAFVLSALNSYLSLGQDVRHYYDTGELKSEITTDKTGLITKYSTWDIFGNLLSSENFETKYQNYPLRDFSHVSWIPITKGLSIFKFNTKDTALVVTDSSFVTLNYQCYFANGRMLDNSFEKTCPMKTRLNVMVKGFIEGVKKMKPGETALIRIEPGLAYGSFISGNVPANSTLIYLVEFISVD